MPDHLAVSLNDENAAARVDEIDAAVRMHGDRGSGMCIDYGCECDDREECEGRAK
jgi:hypothetical protein